MVNVKKLKELETELFLESKVLSILDTLDMRILIEIKEKDYSILELARVLKINPNTVDNHIKKLTSFELLNKTEASRGQKKFITKGKQFSKFDNLVEWSYNLMIGMEKEKNK